MGHIVAVVEMTAADKHGVLSGHKRPKYVCWIDSARTHQPDHPHVRGVLKPGDTGKVRSGIAAPVAEKS
jgi:hypothetical protein